MTVNIEDINDNIPLFMQSNYSATLVESPVSGDAVVRVMVRFLLKILFCFISLNKDLVVTFLGQYKVLQKHSISHYLLLCNAQKDLSFS